MIAAGSRSDVRIHLESLTDPRLGSQLIRC